MDLKHNYINPVEKHSTANNLDNIDLEVQLLEIPKVNKNSRYKCLCVCNCLFVFFTSILLVYYYTIYNK